MIDNQKKRVFKEWLKHAVNIELYGNNIANTTETLLTELYESIKNILKKNPLITSKQLSKEIEEDLAALFDEYEKELLKTSEIEINKVSKEESDWLLKIAKVAGLSYAIPKNVKSQLKYLPYGTHFSYKDFSKNIINRIKNKVNTMTKTAYIIGTGTNSLINSIDDKMAKEIKYAKLDAQTFNTGLFRNVDRIILSNSVKKVVYLAHLDSRTCLVCGENHLKTFNAKNAPILPIHEHCRCTLIDSELYNEESPKTYEEWLSELSDEELKDILGKSRFKLYKNGIPLSSFVNDGRLISLEELGEK